MSLEKPPPSRYRVEEKNGLLIVHDSMAGGQLTSTAPAPQPRSALGGVSLTSSASPSLGSPAPSSAASGMGGVNAGADSGKAKRGATVAVIGMGLAVFLIFTGLWPIMAIAMLVTPVRKQVLGNIVPVVKRYIDEGRMN